MRKKKEPAKGPRFLSAQEVADRYGLSRRWVYDCRTLPRRKVGKYLVFREDELEEFEMTWKKTTPSHRGFVTKKEMGIAASDNNQESWVNPPEPNPQKPKEKVLMFDFEE